MTSACGTAYATKCTAAEAPLSYTQHGVQVMGLTSACGTAYTDKSIAAEADLSHTQHGVQVIEGPRPVSRGRDEVLIGGMQRHTYHLTRVVRQHSLQTS